MGTITHAPGGRIRSAAFRLEREGASRAYRDQHRPRLAPHDRRAQGRDRCLNRRRRLTRLASHARGGLAGGRRASFSHE